MNRYSVELVNRRSVELLKRCVVHSRKLDTMLCSCCESGERKDVLETTPTSAETAEKGGTTTAMPR